jgi:TonB family protein
MLIALLGLAAGPALPSDPPAINPTSWFSGFSYPPEAAKRKIEDEVHFEVDVDASGNPTACRITFSSGSPFLDQPTCAIIMAKAHFRPALDANGSPVPGHYRNSTVWQLRLGHGPRWAAAIVDLSDPAHPHCTDSTQGGPVTALNCSYLLHHPSLLADLAETMQQFVYFSSMTFDGNKPYRGDPQWGDRVSYSSMDGYYLKGQSQCAVVAAEGLDAIKGLTLKKPCSDFYRIGTVPPSKRDQADQVRIETSIFVIPRKTAGQEAIAR